MLFIVRKELMLQVSSAKFAILTILVVLLSFIGAIVMERDYELRAENYELLKPTGETTVALKRPTPMSILAKGLDDRLGRSITVSSIGILSVGSSQASANRLFALFRELDLHFVALVVMSLAAILFSFDLISREKRHGTLKLTLSNGIGRGRLLLAKWLGALIVVAIPALLAILTCLFYLVFISGTPLDSDFYLRLSTLGLLILFYLAAFVSIGLLISCLTHRPAVSLVFAMLVWAILVFVIPNAAAMAGDRLVGGKSLAEHEFRLDHIWTSRIFEAINDPRLSEPGYDPWDRTYATIGVETAAEYNDYINSAQEKLHWTRTLAHLSPAGPFSFAAWAVAGTGPEDALSFKRDVVSYQGAGMGDAQVLRSMARNAEGAPESFRARVFAARKIGLAEVVFAQVIPALVALALMAAVFFVFGQAAFARYDVR